MADQGPSLQDLRRQIDATDEALHDLLVKRSEIVEQVKRLKLAGGTSIPFSNAFSAAREAQVMGRLLARQKGSLSSSLVARLWREILSSALMFQSPYSVFVCGGDGATPLWDAARAAFGAGAPMTLLQSAANVVRSCAQSGAAFGVLAWPATDAGSAPAWWSQLATPDHSGPRIVARLPFFFQAPQERDMPPIAAVIAPATFEPSGNDSTMAVVDIPADLSRARLLTLLKQAELSGYVIAANGNAGRSGGMQVLILLEGYIAPDDSRLAALADLAKDQINWARVIGGFANPIELAAVAESPA